MIYFCDMKPFYTKATTDYDSSITIRYDERSNFYPHWHYHDEYELVFVHKSSGIRYVGDSINPFQPGDFVLIGSGLPHIWLNDISPGNREEAVAAATVIHFQRKFVHSDFFDLLLMKEIKKLFQKSHQGIRFLKLKGIEETLKKIEEAHSAKKVIVVLDLLHKLSRVRHTELLGSKNFKTTAVGLQNDKMGNIHNYIVQNFRNKISLETLASMAHMTPQAFCKYFKSKSRKPVFAYINDLRIGYCCKMLIETDLNIDQVALGSGYNNTTFFNRKFKEKMKMTPKEYRKQFKF